MPHHSIKYTEQIEVDHANLGGRRLQIRIFWVLCRAAFHGSGFCVLAQIRIGRFPISGTEVCPTLC
jgi:hypothetical protein